jgi:hypothetical protein
VRNLLPAEDRLPRTVLKFAKKDDLWISGMLDKGEELAERPAVLDCPVGKGHVVLFANNPMWRWQTHGSHALPSTRCSTGTASGSAAPCRRRGRRSSGLAAEDPPDRPRPERVVRTLEQAAEQDFTETPPPQDLAGAIARRA